jgi:hypothetical protein
MLGKANQKESASSHNASSAAAHGISGWSF